MWHTLTEVSRDATVAFFRLIGICKVNVKLFNLLKRLDTDTGEMA